jgi:hypothetical protein
MYFHYSGDVKTLRVILGILAIVPLTLLTDSFLHPESYGEGTLGELLFPIFGVPIVIFNLWVWLEPEILES